MAIRQSNIANTILEKRSVSTVDTGATSIRVTSTDNTVIQTSPSLYSPVNKRIDVDLVAKLNLPIAQPDTLGGIKPDNSTIQVDPITGIATAIATSPIQLPLSIDNGGTGQTTQENALLALLPSIDGQDGKVLGVINGVISWVEKGGSGTSYEIGDGLKATLNPDTGKEILSSKADPTQFTYDETGATILTTEVQQNLDKGASSVQSVNNETPDAQGNVEIATGGITPEEAEAIAQNNFDTNIIPIQQEIDTIKNTIIPISQQLYLLQLKVDVIQDWLGINTTLLLGASFQDKTDDQIFNDIYTAIPSNGTNLTIVFATDDIINFDIPFTKESFGALGNLYDVADYIQTYCQANQEYPLSMFLCSWDSSHQQFVMTTTSNEIRIYTKCPNDNIMGTAMLLTQNTNADLEYIASFVNNGTIYARVVKAQITADTAEADAQQALLENKATQKELDAVHVRLDDVHKTFIDVDITTDVQNEFMGIRTNVLRGASFVKSVVDQHDVVVYMNDAEVFALLYEAIPSTGNASCNIKFNINSTATTVTQTWTKLQFSKLKTMQNVALDIQKTCRAFSSNLTSVTAWWKSGIEGACLAISTNWNNSIMMYSADGDFSTNLQLTQSTKAQLLELGLNSDATQPNLYGIATHATQNLTPNSSNVHIVYDANRNATIAVDESSGTSSDFPLYTWAGVSTNTSINTDIITVAQGGVFTNPFYNTSLVFSITKINGSGNTSVTNNKTIYGQISFSANTVTGLASYEFGATAQSLTVLQQAQQQSQSLNIYFTVNKSGTPSSVPVNNVTVADVASFQAFALKITKDVTAYNPSLYKTFVCQYNPLLNKFSLSILNANISFPKVGGSGNPLHEASGLFKSNLETIVVNNIDCGVANTGLSNSEGGRWKYTYDPNDPNSLKNIEITTGIIDFTADLSKLLNPVYWNLAENNIALFTFTPESVTSAGSVNYLPNFIAQNYTQTAYNPFAFTLTGELGDYGQYAIGTNMYLNYSYKDVNQGNGAVSYNVKLSKYPQLLNKFTQYIQAMYVSAITPIGDYQVKLIIDATDSQYTINGSTYFADTIKISKTDSYYNPTNKCYEIPITWTLNCNNNNILIDSGIKSTNGAVGADSGITLGSDGGQSDLSQARDALLIPDKLSIISGDVSHVFIDVVRDVYGNKIQTISLSKGYKYKVRILGTVYTNNPITESLKVGIINTANKMEDYTIEIFTFANYRDWVKVDGEIVIDLTEIEEDFRVYRKCIMTYESHNAIAKLEDSLGFTFYEE